MITRQDSGFDPLGLVGETVAGRFLVERGVAEGGFGVVYRARHVGLERAVALKVLKPPIGGGPAAQEFQRSFETEARAIARLEHPNIVAVYDFGVSSRPSGAPLHWIALEWLEGRTLEALLEERRAQAAPGLSSAEALALLRPVIESIAFAHQRGIVHRDLKPANVFLHEQAGKQVPKVLDFGIARMVAPDQEPPQAGSGATTRSFPAFSPDYAAPEQVTHGRTGPWTDVHALALILTELLTGLPPYGSASGDGEAGPFDRVISLQRPTPGSKGIGVGDWERVLAKALARRPADRHADAEAFISALDRSLPAENSFPPAVPRETTPRHPPLWRRWQTMVAAVLVLSSASLTAWWTMRPTASDRFMMAVLPFANLTGDPQQEYLADGLTDGMISQLGQVSPQRLAVIARTSIAQYKGTNKRANQIGRELGVSHLMESSVKYADARLRIDVRLIQISDETQVWAESYDRDIKDVPALQTSIAQSIATAVRIKAAQGQPSTSSKRSVNPAAYDAYLRGRHFNVGFAKTKLEARKFFQKAITLDPDYAPAYAGLAITYVDSTDAGIPERRTEAKAAALRAVALDPDLPEAHLAASRVMLRVMWDWPAAEHHLERALALNPNDAEGLVYGAQVPTSLGQFDRALTLRKRGAELSPADQRITIGVGITHLMARRYDKAVEELKRTVDLDPSFEAGHQFLGTAYAYRGSYSEALGEFAKCREAPRCLARVAAWAYARSGRNTEARGVVEQLHALARNRLVEPIFFARAYAALGDRSETLAWLERSFLARDPDLVFLRVDRDWDFLRGDPRFDDLIRRVGIPPIGSPIR